MSVSYPDDRLEKNEVHFYCHVVQEKTLCLFVLKTSKFKSNKKGLNSLDKLSDSECNTWNRRRLHSRSPF